ncbi:MAG: hypothetical protein JWQ88_3766 [Rhodoferax sp.]|nr:hypothetical protein [Rhodoferax sp.]
MTPQNALFPEFDDDLTAPGDAPPATGDPPPVARQPRSARPAPAVRTVRLAPPDPAWLALAAALPRTLRLGTSSWTYPGWAGLVWDGEHPDTLLSRQGLAAYGQHPMLRTVCLDRNFYRPLTASQYARYADQVPDDFRFVVKAPSLVTDALVRAENGRGMQANTGFLQPELALQEFVQPALEGLGHKLGALVFQLSPLPAALLARLPEVLGRLAAMLAALPPLQPAAPDGVFAVEVRDPAFITAHAPQFADVLRGGGATFCLGLHPKMPPLEAQLPMLRALWPAPLVCRWNQNRLFGPHGYEEAEKAYAPFDTLIDADPATRRALARVISGTVGRGLNAFVTASNHAEGCAPRTLRLLAEAVLAQAHG